MILLSFLTEQQDVLRESQEELTVFSTEVVSYLSFASLPANFTGLINLVEVCTGNVSARHFGPSYFTAL